MRWFGPSWGAPVCDEGDHVETPVGERCEYCEKKIEERDQGLMLAYVEVVVWSEHPEWRYFPVHLDCLLEMTGAKR